MLRATEAGDRTVIFRAEHVAIEANNRQAKRDAFLRALYDQSDGDPTAIAYGTGERVGITEDNELLDVTRYLEKEGLLTFRTTGFGISITQYGASAVEATFAPNSDDARRLADKEADRVAFLVKTYDMVNGSDMESVNYREVAAALGWDEQRAVGVMNYLNEHGLAQWRFLGGGIAITHDGIRWAEQNRSAT